MKIIRLGIISIVFLFAVITGISLFIPSVVRISRAINVKAPQETVLTEISDLNQWRNWYPGFDTLTIIPAGPVTKPLTEARVASTSTTISVKTKNDGEIVALFRGGSRNPVTSGWKLITYSSSDSLTVQWYLDFSLHWYPWEKFLSLTYDKIYGQQMEKGLNALKKNVEQ